MSLAICLMVKDEAPYLGEWLAFHSLMGVGHFRIYDNGSTDGTIELLNRLAHHFNINVVHWSVTGIARQQTAFNDAARALAGKWDWVAFLDADEFLFDPAFRPLPSMLTGMSDQVGAVAVNQRIFGSSGLTELSDDLVIRRFTKRALLGYPEHQWIKTIARPERVDSFLLSHTTSLTAGHYVLADGEPFAHVGWHPGHADRIATQGIVMHHYMLKSLGEYRRKQQRGAVSDREGHTRLTDDYFSKRDANVNAEDDPILVRIADLVAARLQFALDVTSLNRPGQPLMPVARPVRLPELPHEGFHRADTMQLCWLRQDEVGRIGINAQAGQARLRIVTYMATPDYPIERVAITLNGNPVAFAVRPLTDNWRTLEIELVTLRDGVNEITLTAPKFIPVRDIHPDALDTRHVSIAVTELVLLV